MMSEGNSDDSSGVNTDASGDGDKSPTVSRDNYEKVLREKRNKDAALAAANARLAEYESKEKEEENARKAGDFAKLEESWKAKLSSVESENKTLKEERIFSKKVSAFSRVLEGKVPTKYLDLVNFDKIELDDSGSPIAASVSKLADDFKKEFPEIFKVSGGVPDTNPKGGGTGKLTVAEWKSLPLKEKKARMHEDEDL
jgi:hypothetical protein